MHTTVAEVRPENLTAEQMRQLLAIQVKTGPSYFGYYPETGRLQLNHRVDSNTVGRFMDALTEYLGDLDNSRSVWMPLYQAGTQASNR
jgi:hypothetical protein